MGKTPGCWWKQWERALGGNGGDPNNGGGRGESTEHWGRQWENMGEMTTTAPPRMGSEMGETLVEERGREHWAVGHEMGESPGLW